MPGFAERIKQHDKLALEAVRAVLAGRGIKLHPSGGELSPVLHKELRFIGNGTSKMLRYRPDQVAVIPGKKALLLEIKSEAGGSPNFSVELDAWEAAKIWNRNGRHVLYVFADLKSGSVFGAWPEEIFPSRIFVPRSADLKRVAAYPGVPVRRVAVRGSGTAFFLVKKKNLCSLESTLDNLG
ncbi:MAG: hypothetical protein C4575_06995 [Desulforudis sp.]|nr:MAG: hypothetical protein C4575_06995 [Desulforudis sp.]